MYETQAIGGEDGPYMGLPSSISFWQVSLRKLRDHIGPARYYAGDWGPWVPVWRFTSRD